MTKSTEFKGVTSVGFVRREKMDAFTIGYKEMEDLAWVRLYQCYRPVSLARTIQQPIAPAQVKQLTTELPKFLLNHSKSTHLNRQVTRLVPFERENPTDQR